MIATEQMGVDHAYVCLERTLVVALEGQGTDAAASGKDSIALRQSYDRQIESLDLKGRALVVARADVGDGEERERFYIGRRGINDDEGNRIVVHWSTPAAMRWQETDEHNPGEVSLLRRLTCQSRKVQNYLDVHGTDSHLVTSVEPNSIDEAEPELRDPLLEELDRARDGSMHDIVETIQREQLRLVGAQPDGVLVIQGGPGTGKTAVGVHRVTWLLHNEHNSAKDILIVGPNRGFLEYVGTALDELGTRGVTMLEFPALWDATKARHDDAAVAGLKSDSRMADVLQRAVDGRPRTSVEQLTDIVDGPVFTFELNRREVVVSVEAISAIAVTALAREGPYTVRREGCVLRILQLLTDAYVGTLPGPADDDYLPHVAEVRAVRNLLASICPDLTSREALHSLLASPAAMSDAAEGILTPEEQATLTAHRGKPGRRRAAEFSHEDLVCLDELEYVLSGRPERVYGHVVIDEAQDMTPMEARSLARRCPGGSMTILGDLAQATGVHPHQNWDLLASTLAGRHEWEVRELRTGFRVPRAVMEFAAPLAALCADGPTVPTSVRETAAEVVVHHDGAPMARAMEVAGDLIGNQGGAADSRSVGVIVSAQGSSAVAFEATPSGLAVLTAAEAKGLEFDHVVVVEPSAIATGPYGLRHLYVALTRCTQSLTIVHQAPLPHALGGPAPASPTPLQMSSSTSGVASEAGEPRRCSRYHEDGTRCRATTGRPDGWCRAPACGGFRTSEPPGAPLFRQLAVLSGGDSHVKLELPSAEMPRTRVSARARNAFVTRHRGTPAEAVAELHSMLVPFVAKGAHYRRPSGQWVLTLDGFRLTLSRDATTVTNYESVHSERSYAQHSAGVVSRVGKDARARHRSHLTPARAEQMGPALDEGALRRLDVTEMHITAAACKSYEHLNHDGRHLSDDDFVQGMQVALANDLAEAAVIETGSRILIDGASLQWHLAVDGRSLIYVLQARTPARYQVPDPQETNADPDAANKDTMMDKGTVTAPGLGQGSTSAHEGLGPQVAQRIREARADGSHKALRYRLLADLYESGITGVGEGGEFVDAWCERPDGLTLFGVVGAGESTYAHIREAVLHILEAAHLHPGESAEHLVIVLREPPVETWAAEAVDGAFAVNLAWREGDGWAGPGAALITSGS
ncbi:MULTISPECIES: HelD family protein [unclassified Streptomyces]|uniref:HelD family protein n=1 Tax=unclassified Streptomyces TaxID=2593676 RepID=UPI001314D39D|nr:MULTISPECIES: UvrD-helicase domain-containing protein [unclassified Streptomyces]